MSLQLRITLTYIALTLVGIAIVGFLSSWQIENYLERRTTEGLNSQLEAVANLVRDGNLVVDSTGRRDLELTKLARALSVRLTMIRKDGVVVYDSDVRRDSLHRMENHGTRPEILRARTGILGTDRRKSVSVDEEFLYAARMIHSPALGQLDSSYVRAALRLTELHRVDRQVQAIVWGVGILALAITIVVSLQISRRITRPILEIVSAAQDIKNGNLERRIPVSSKDEIGKLSVAINNMAATLSTDIGRLRKLERIRSEFLANVSHELRTPIFSIQGFLETLLDGAIDDPSVNRDFLEKAHRHTQRLNALLNDLIEISRIESGEMRMSFRYFPLHDFLKQVIDEFVPSAQQKGLVLSLEPISESVQAYGDRDRLRQVMVNLIDNAIKYTEKGGSIRCSAVEKAEMVEVRVQDTGSGIAEEHQARIFERFYRVDKDRSREVGGTGLGLAIAKHIVEAHGGTIRVESTPGKGSTFSFQLKR